MCALPTEREQHSCRPRHTVWHGRQLHLRAEFGSDDLNPLPQRELLIVPNVVHLTSGCGGVVNRQQYHVGPFAAYERVMIANPPSGTMILVRPSRILRTIDHSLPASWRGP